MDTIILIQIEDTNMSPIQIQCKTGVKMSHVFAMFKNKAFAEQTDVDLNDYLFYYNGEKIDKDLTVAQLKKNQESSITFITARKRTKIMKCPICISNTCFIQIDNYGVKFSGCPYKHTVEKTFKDYEQSQKIDYSQIKCDKCGITQNRYLRNFYKCLKCSEEFKRSSYFCEDCLKIHSGNDGENHQAIKYEDKYYLCSKHSIHYISYCTKCNKDLCELCEKKHKGHNIIKYDSINPDVKTIKEGLEEIRKKTAKAKSHIDQIIRMLNDAVIAFEKYYEVCMDIVSKYELYNIKYKNYNVINTVRFLPKSSEKIVNDLNDILEGNKSKNDYLNKCKILFDIFTKDIEKYICGVAVENKNMEKDPPVQMEIKKDISQSNSTNNSNLTDNSSNNISVSQKNENKESSHKSKKRNINNASNP